MTEMSPAEVVFFTAAALAPADRATYLARACAGRDDLRQQVERMLAARADVGDFLEPRPAATGAYPPDAPPTATFGTGASATSDLPGRDEHVGTLIAGKYKLMEEIGEGGMGSVFMAQQTEPVRRAVAVKVIKAGMDSKAVLARFDAERQALAMMDHPNIARVLDAGTTESGRPFFVMELVKGVPITEFCDARKLTPRERLELFIPVCQAIQHAHMKGIIHRDIKPSNVLVAMYDDRPVPKVIDFGVAKAAGSPLTDKTLMTGYGAVVGTPEYMSPEQASFNQVDVDTRSDVYALGVLLYELLTGTTPVDRKSLGKAALLEILRIVREVETPRPSAKLSTLDTLANVAANRNTEPAKLSKLMKGELDWILLKALEKDRTRRYDTANGLARDVQRYLADEVVEARPPSSGYRLKKFVRRHKGQVIAASLVLFALLTGMVGTTWGLIEAKRQEGEAKRREQIAREETSEKEKARQAEAERAEGERRAKEDAQEQKSKAELARDNEARERGYAEAIARFVKDDFLALTSVEGQGRFGGEESTRNATLRELLDRAAEKLKERKGLAPRTEAKLCWIIGVSYRGVGESARAIPFLKRSVELHRQTSGPEAEATLDAQNSLAVAYSVAGQNDLALRLHEETLKLQKARLGPEHPHALATMNNLAGAYLDAGKLDKAVPLFEETLKLMKAKLGPEHPYTLKSMGGLAGAYQSAGKLDLALPLYDETLKLMKARLGPEYPHTFTTMKNLLSAYAEAGETAKAVQLLPEVLSSARKRLPKDSPQLAQQLAIVGLSLLEAKAFAEAEPLLRECLAIREKKQPDAWTTFNVQSMLGGALLGQKKYAEAEPLLVKGYVGMKAREKTIPQQGAIRLPEAIDRLIELYVALDKPDEVKKWRAERAKYPDVAPMPREKK